MRGLAKLDVLVERYPEVAEGMLEAAGLSEPDWKSSELSEDHEKILEFAIYEFEEVTEDELFEAFQEEKTGELDDDSRLLEREYFFDCLDDLATAGHLPRLSMGSDEGFYYCTAYHCLIELKAKGETDGVGVDQLYRYEEETGVPLQVLVHKLMGMQQMSLKIPDTEKDRIEER